MNQPLPWVNFLVTLAFIGIYAWAQYAEKKKTRQYHLPPNPDRCAEMSERIKNVEKDLVEIKIIQAATKEKIASISRQIDNIGDVFKMAGDPKI